MSLIKCEECETSVSSKVAACSQCGCLKGIPTIGRTTQAHSRKAQTTELTSKRYKLQLMLSVVLIIVSILVTAAGAPTLLGMVGVLGLLAGLRFK
jgi:uncharacterized paraquat-inducible protein A